MYRVPSLNSTTSLGRVVEESMFFARSLGRFHLDFQSSIAPTFENHLVSLMNSQWKKACLEFHQALCLLPTTTRSDDTSYISQVVDTSSELSMTPQGVLVFYPSLAQLTNAFLTSFNDLRHCSISSTHIRLSRLLFSYLDTIPQSIELLLVLNTTSTDDDDITKLKRTTREIFIPYIKSAFKKAMTIHHDFKS